MLPELIIQLLSSHRQTIRDELPQSLHLSTIITLIREGYSPQQLDITAGIKGALGELQAEGEVLAGLRNRFCMAPPVVLGENEENLSGLIFKGDRAYLKLAHQVLETGQSFFKTQLRPKVHSFHRIRERLEGCGIKLLTIPDSLEHLPLPGKPKLHLLSGSEWSENPFQCWSASSLIQAYLPTSEWQVQSDRWQFITQSDLRGDSLLKLSTGEYLWFEADQFYELSPNTASLAMFWLDQQAGLPVRVTWDEVPGRLSLQGMTLPSSYAQWLWRLSKPDPDQPRTRLFDKPSQRPSVRAAMCRLGCILV